MTNKNIDYLANDLQQEIYQAKSLADIENLRIKYLGKKGYIKELLESAKNLPKEEQEEFWRKVSSVKKSVEELLEENITLFKQKEIEAKIEQEWLDFSLPGYIQKKGAIHSLTEIEYRCTSILRQLGFEVAEGPEVEDPYYNFDALNIPEHHPARDMQDTFWVEGNLLLRSHTTTVQARTLESRRDKLPIKIVSPGRVYRNETVDPTHLACFHQYEGLWVGYDVKFSHLKGTIEFFLKALYGQERKVRFKPKFYPYTEPSLGVDISCGVCNGEGCKSCHYVGWVTVGGAGMVHPNVLEEFGYNSKEITGFAFGMGISRIVSQFYNVKNMRSLYGMDLRVHEAIKRKVGVGNED